MPVIITPGAVKLAPLIGFPGDWSAKSINDGENSASWLGGEHVDIWTTTVGGFTNSHAYKLYLTAAGLPTRTVTYTSDSSSSIDEIVQGLTDAWNDDPIVTAYGTAVADLTANTVTITGISAFIAITITDNTTDLSTAHTQTATTGSAISFARVAIKDTTALTNPTPKALPVTSLTAKAVTGSITYAASAFYEWSIVIAGVTYGGVIAADTNTATTRAALVASINAVMPSDTVLAASGSAGAFTLTAEVAGQPFVPTVWSTGAAISVTDTAVATDDLSKVCLGVTLRRSDLAGNDLSTNVVQYAPGQALSLARYGRVWVDADGTPASNGKVYVDNATGKLGASSGSTKVYLPNASWSGRVNDDATAYEVVLSLPLAA